MIKNNLKSFLIHVIISIVSIFVFFIFNAVQAKWVSEEAARNHHYKMMVIAIIWIVVSIILYYFLGRILLINQGSVYKNFFAVSFAAMIGIFFWIIAFNIDLTGSSNHLLNSELWQYYSMYNGYCLFFLDESGCNNQYVFLFFSFIPTIVMGIGMQKKRS